MAHHTLRSGYAGLVDRLNRFPQGAPPSDLLYSILKMPPLKQAMASRQMKSRYLETILSQVKV